MLKRVLLSVTVVLGLIGLVPPAAHAALSCPVTLTHDTTLTQDLDCSSLTSGYAVQFGASHLTLDLNGHSILGHSGPDSAYGVYDDSYSNPYTNETIKNGSIANFDTGIELYYSSGSLVKNVKVVSDAADTYSEGIYIYYGADNTLRNDTVNGAHYGFDLEYSGGNRVLHSTANQSTEYGFYTTDETGDLFRADTSNGISATTYGFYDSEYSNLMRYINNKSNGGYEGFYLDCDEYGAPVSVRGNTANNNSYIGFYLYYCYDVNNYRQSGASIINNTANHNGDDGFFDEHSIHETYRGNTAQGNGSYGFNLDEPVGALVRGNTANGNSNDGFYLESNESYYNVRSFAANVANHNSSYGFDADYGAPGGGNQAHHNAGGNCYNVRCG